MSMGGYNSTRGLSWVWSIIPMLFSDKIYPEVFTRRTSTWCYWLSWSSTPLLMTPMLFIILQYARMYLNSFPAIFYFWHLHYITPPINITLISQCFMAYPHFLTLPLLTRLQNCTQRVGQSPPLHPGPRRARECHFSEQRLLVHDRFSYAAGVRYCPEVRLHLALRGKLWNA